MTEKSKKKVGDLLPEIIVSKKSTKAHEAEDDPSAPPQRLTDEQAANLLENVFRALETMGLTDEGIDPANLPSEEELQEALAALLPEGSEGVTIKLHIGDQADSSLLMDPSSAVPDYIEDALSGPLNQEDIVQKALRQRSQKTPGNVVSGPKTLQ